MKRMIAKPQLGFAEAVKLASKRLFEFNGRSRRSEFWWFMLAFTIAIYIINSILQMLLPLLIAEIINLLMWGIALAVTVRRLQDTGHSKWWVIISWIATAIYDISVANSGIIDELSSVNADPTVILQVFKNPVIMASMIVYMLTGIVTLVFCILDGTPEANTYGASPKYVVTEEGDETES